MLGRRIPQNDLALTIIDEYDVIELTINDPGHGSATISHDEGNIIEKRPTGLYAAGYDDTSIRTETGKKADAVEGSSLVTNEEITKLEGIQAEATKNRTDEQMDERYVRQAEGKGLSDNNYTTEDKNKLAGLENYDPTRLAQSFNQALQLKVEKEEDKSLVSNAEITKLKGISEKATKNRSDEQMDERYVRTQTGKGLSTQNYTTEEKNKLKNVQDGATKTEIAGGLGQSETKAVSQKLLTVTVGNIEGILQTINGETT